MTPERLEVCDGGRLLRVVWRDGRPAEIGAALLRAECRSAGARRARIDNRAPAPGDVRIAALHPVGNYAVNIAFSDGQDRGIYDSIGRGIDYERIYARLDAMQFRARLGRW